MLDQDVVNLLHYLMWQVRYSEPEISDFFGKTIHEVFFCSQDTTPEYDAQPYMEGNQLPSQLRQFIKDVDNQLNTVPHPNYMFGFPVSIKKPRHPKDMRDAFVAMPYGEPWSPKVEQTIIEAGESQQFKCIVSKDLRKPGSIINQVWQDIRKSEVLIADLTSRNPNVYYELGLANALGKHSILLLQKDEQLPFDVGSQRCIHYDSDNCDQLKTELSTAFSQIPPRYAFDGES